MFLFPVHYFYIVNVQPGHFVKLSSRCGAAPLTRWWSAFVVNQPLTPSVGFPVHIFITILKHPVREGVELLLKKFSLCILLQQWAGHLSDFTNGFFFLWLNRACPLNFTVTELFWWLNVWLIATVKSTHSQFKEGMYICFGHPSIHSHYPLLPGLRVTPCFGNV